MTSAIDAQAPGVLSIVPFPAGTTQPRPLAPGPSGAALDRGQWKAASLADRHSGGASAPPAMWPTASTRAPSACPQPPVSGTASLVAKGVVLAESQNT